MSWSSLVCLGLCLVSAWIPVDEDVQLIAGLRERRLFELAEQHCRRLMAQPNRTATQSASDAIELIKTRTAKALLANGPDRNQAWSSVQEIMTEFQQRPNHPRQILVSIQTALAHLARGQQLRQELVAEMAAESDRALALEELRVANSRFTDIQLEIQKQIPLQRNRSLSEHELTGEELQKLNNQIRLQLALVNLNRAQLFSLEDRLNRIDVLGNVVDRLNEIQRETQPHQPIWWQANALQIECFRLLKKFPEAVAFTKLVDELGADQINLAQGPWLEQQLLLALDLADESASMKYLQAAEVVPQREPALDLARLATAMDFSLRDVTPGKVEWLNRAAQLARSIEAQHGSYWGRRAKLILIKGGLETAAADPNRGSPSTSSSAEIDLLISLAEQAERQNRWEDALQAYDRASIAAFQLEATAQGFSLSVKAAQVLEKLTRNREAAERLIQLANDHQAYSLASAAHLRGCWNWARLLPPATAASNSNSAKSKEEIEIRSRYEQLLREHLKVWPQADTANQIRIWLGSESQKVGNPDAWQQAFEQFSAVQPNSSLFGTAIQQAGYSARQWIATAPANDQIQIASQAFQRLQLLVENSLPNSASQQQSLLVMVELGIRFGVVEPKELLNPLRSLLTSDQDLDPARQQQAAAWLYAIEAVQPNSAERLPPLLSTIAVDRKWLALADQGMASIMTKRAVKPNPEIARARAALAEIALDRFSSQMENSERSAWRYRLADAWVEAGESSAALNVLRELERELPTDAGIKLRLARLLTATDSDLAASLQRWRQLAAQLKPNSDGWFEAKYQVAWLLEKSGEKAEAKKLLEYMKAIPPGWEDSKMRDEFNQLLQRVR